MFTSHDHSIETRDEWTVKKKNEKQKGEKIHSLSFSHWSCESINRFTKEIGDIWKDKTMEMRGHHFNAYCYWYSNEAVDLPVPFIRSHMAKSSQVVTNVTRLMYNYIHMWSDPSWPLVAKYFFSTQKYQVSESLSLSSRVWQLLQVFVVEKILVHLSLSLSLPLSLSNVEFESLLCYYYHVSFLSKAYVFQLSHSFSLSLYLTHTHTQKWIKW